MDFGGLKGGGRKSRLKWARSRRRGFICQLLLYFYYVDVELARIPKLVLKVTTRERS